MNTRKNDGVALVGYLQSQGDPTVWRPTGSEDQLLDHDVNSVIVGETIDECIQSLMFRFPTSHPLLTRVRYIPVNGFYRSEVGSHVNFHDSDSIYICEHGKEKYCGKDPEDLMAVAEALGRTVEVAESCLDKDDADWQGRGFVIKTNRPRWGSAYVQSVRYSPAAVARGIKGAATRGKNRSVSSDDIYQAAYGLFNTVRSVYPFTDYVGLSGTRSEACSDLLYAIKWFNHCFGKNAHRRHRDFQNLRREWKAHEAATRRAYTGSTAYDRMNHREIVCNLMEEELTKRAVKVNNVTWTPVKETENFHEYREHDYAPRREARKAAAAKKGKTTGTKAKGLAQDVKRADGEDQA